MCVIYVYMSPHVHIYPYIAVYMHVYISDICKQYIHAIYNFVSALLKANMLSGCSLLHFTFNSIHKCNIHNIKHK